MKHQMPKLQYAAAALAPRMSEETINFHFGKHLQTYIDNINKLIVGTPYEEMHLKEIIKTAQPGAVYNNAAQAWNHILFFRELTPTPVHMGTTLSQAIAARWGSFEAFKEEFTKAAVGLFGSGWVFLALDEQRQLQIVSEPNAGNPMTKNMRPLMCIDVWEHAYYLDYQNRRAAYVENFWPLIDWAYVEHRYSRDDAFLYY